MKTNPKLTAAFITLTFGITIIPVLQASNITNALVVHLPFDNTYDDTSGNGLHGTPVGAPTFGTGRIGAGSVVVTSAKDSSSFNYVTLGAPPQLNFGGASGGATDFSISMWVKFNIWEGDPSFIANKNWNSGDNIGYVLATASNGGFQWNFNDGSGRRDYDGPGGTISGTNWHQIAVSFQRNGNAKAYVDGVLVDSRSLAPMGASIDPGLPTNIGQDGTGAYTDGNSVSITNGMIDDVGIWRRVLSGNEIAQIYRLGTNGMDLTGVVDPPHPIVDSLSPANNQTDVRVDAAIVAVIQDGTLPLDPGTVQMTFNGGSVTPVLDKVATLTSITYQPPSPLPNNTTNVVRLIYGDTSTSFTSVWQFVTVRVEQKPSITGQWDFESANLAATIGQALEYYDGPSGLTQAGTQFGTTTSFGVPDIGGLEANVIKIPRATTTGIGYIMRHGAVPNGGGSKVNKWTLIMDILIPNQNGETWFSFIQTDPLNADDGEFFARFSGGTAGIGIGGLYAGSLIAGRWHRVAFAVDLTAGSSAFSKYIDGMNVADQGGSGLDGRHALGPFALLFADESDESQPAYVSSIQIRNYKMSSVELAALGGPSAEGIPTVSGQWDFNDGSTAAALLAPTIGNALLYRPDSQLSSGSETVTLGGQSAQVMRFDVNNGYIMCHGALPNGGGTRVNQYTLIMDLLYFSASTGFRSLFQTETNYPLMSDGDLFVNGAHAIGISSYQGYLAPDAWHRVAFTFDLTKRELGKYIDGTNVLSGPVGSSPPPGAGPYQYLSTTTGNVDQRWSLDPYALLFADDDAELAAGYVNSIQFRVGVLSPAQIGLLGPATATGIPLNLPVPPRLRLEMDFENLIISWPDTFVGFILEQSSSLGPSANWTPVPAEQYVTPTSVSVPANLGIQFFRARR